MSAPLGTTLAAALAAGAFGALHCAAMCGPLAAVASSGRARGAAAYLGGRVLGYAAVGALLGAIGEHALCRLPMHQVQILSTVLLVAVFAWQAVRTLWPARPATATPTLGTRPRRTPLASRVGALLARLPRHGLALGLATAILPCGMLLPAWALAATAGSVPAGALAMTAFALASAPGLLAPALAGPRLARLGARWPRALHGALWLGMALYVGLRPLLHSGHHH